jgi:hypothetical protein
MNEVDEWTELHARYMAEAIDKEIIIEIQRKICMEKGWVQAPFKTDKFIWPFEHKLAEVVAWIHVNHTDEYQVFGNEFWFKSKKDLTAFVLRWT